MAAFLGLAIGFVLGVTSAGSGALITVVLILVFRLAPRQVVGTDMFHAAILLWAAALAHVVAGDVDYGLAGTILIGSVPGVWLGSTLIYRVPVGALRIALALLLVGASMALLQKAGAGIPTPILAAFPLAIGALFVAAFLRSRDKVAPAELRSLDRPSSVAAAPARQHPAGPGPVRGRPRLATAVQAASSPALRRADRAGGADHVAMRVQRLDGHGGVDVLERDRGLKPGLMNRPTHGR